MSLDSSKPEIPASTGSDKFVEGHHPTDRVRPFKRGDLPDVHDDLLERGVPDANTIHPDTLDYSTDKIPLHAETLPDSLQPAPPITERIVPRWKKLLAVTLGGTVLVGGGMAAYKAGQNAQPEQEQPPISATPNETPDTDTEPTTGTETGKETDVAIDQVVKAATPEQIAFVKNNPVNITDTPALSAAIEQLGYRYNVMLNSGKFDYDTGDSVTSESQADLYDMASAVLAPEDPGYESIMTGLQERRLQIAAMLGDPTLGGDPTAETLLNFRNTGPDAQLEAGQVYTAPIEVIFSTNRPDTQSADGKYNDDYSANMTVIVTDQGEVHITTITDSINIGNVG